MEEENFFKDIINKKKIIIKFFSWINFIIFIGSFYFIFLIGEYFFEFEINKYYFYFLIFFLTLIIFRLNFFYTLQNPFKEINFKKYLKKTTTKNKGIKEFSFQNLNYFMEILIFLRIIFFEILKNMFFYIIILTIIYLICTLFGIVCLKKSSTISFFNFIILTNIILGILQFYIKIYKQNIFKNLMEKINNFLLEQKEKFSFEEFEKFCNDELKKSKLKKSKLKNPFKTIGKKLIHIEKEILNITFHNNTDKNKKPNYYLLPLQSTNFDLLEKFYEDKDNLKKIYNEFFNFKKKEIKKEFKNLPKRELKGLFLENISFLDEQITGLMKIETIEKNKIKLETYEDFSNNIFSEILSDLVNYIIKKDKK